MTAGAATVGLYVHVPFCEAKCTYCHFAIDPRSPDGARQERYVRAVLREMGTAEPAAADTLYLGGGTPSQMAPERVGRIVTAARDRFSLSPQAEVTVEANPGDLDDDGYRQLASLGVNRLSLGAQAFDDGVLIEMGRHHRAAETVRAVGRVRAAGIPNLSLDAILGWPGETRERWGRTLDGLLDLAPQHVSLYVLEVAGRNVLAHRQRRGGLGLPDDDLVADLYLETVERLGEQGLERYEISNFALPGFESRHNRKHWDGAPYLGFGMSAHSRLGARRWWNLDRYAPYCRALESGGAPRTGEEELSPLAQAQEALFTGLRRVEGVDLDDVRRRHGVDPRALWAGPLAEVTEAGLLVTKGERLSLTERGMLLSNEVFRIFV